MVSGTDRLSDLPDGVLGSILSCLPTKEAARAALLSRRWRHTFADVDAVSFVDPGPPIYGYNDDFAFVMQSLEKRSRNGDLIDDVNAALLCRRRCAAPPRFFRVHFSRYDCWDDAMLSQWLRYLLKPRGTGQQEALTHLDLRLQATVLGEHLVGDLEDEDDGNECPAQNPYIPFEEDPHTWPRYTLPTRLFSHAALRTLCLGGCMLLDPPELIHLPLLETLLLSSISKYATRGDSIQRLISACPRLADLTLESCRYTEKTRYYTTAEDPGVDTSYTIRVLDKRLRRLAIRCCHNLVSMCIDASELRVFEYRGAVPANSFLTLHGANNIASCTIGFCGKKVYDEELPRFRKFLEHFTGTKHLHLVSTHLGAGIESKSFPGFPSFRKPQRLELTGYLQRGSVEAMLRILEQAPSIEVLSLFMKPSYEKKNSCSVLQVQSHVLGDQVGVPDVSIPSLRNRVREINLVHYQDHEAQRNVAKLLLCNAMVLERVCVVLPRGPRESQTKLVNEIKGWVVNRMEIGVVEHQVLRCFQKCQQTRITMEPISLVISSEVFSMCFPPWL